MIPPVMTKVSGLLDALVARCQLSEGEGWSLFKLRLLLTTGGECVVRFFDSVFLPGAWRGMEACLRVTNAC